MSGPIRGSYTKPEGHRSRPLVSIDSFTLGKCLKRYVQGIIYIAISSIIYTGPYMLQICSLILEVSISLLTSWVYKVAHGILHVNNSTHCGTISPKRTSQPSQRK
jgi:hypothetical protein